MSRLNAKQMVYVMFHTWRGALLPVAVVAAAALYPVFGFTKRQVAGSVATDRRQVMTAFEVAGFSLVGEVEGVMTFRASGFVKRLTMLFEDEIRVSQCGEYILLDGNRRGVARVAYQLDSYIRNKRRDE